MTPASVVFGSGVEFSGSYITLTPVTVTELVANDGLINVGDEVSFASPGASVQWTNFSTSGTGTAYYLGNRVEGGRVGYVFGQDPDLANNTAVTVLFDPDATLDQPTLLNLYTAFGTWFYTSPLAPLATTTACFAEGTLIATPNGEVAIEALCPGDAVQTADGRSVAAKWIGRQTIVRAFAGDKARLVRIAAGVLGTHAELRVTQDHGMMVDGLVINAGALVGQPGIDLVPLGETPDRFTVYHIETEAHDVILANGAPSETFIDYAGRRAFDNYAEYVEMYGAERIIREMPQPRISSARMLPESLRVRLQGQTDVAQQAVA